MNLRISLLSFFLSLTGSFLMLFDGATTYAQPVGESSHMFGDSTLMQDESLLFYRAHDGDSPVSHLLFPAKHIIRMTNTAGDMMYIEGKDFTLSDDGITIALTPTSRIPFFTPADLYLKSHDPNGISYKRGDPNTWLLWGPKTDPFLHTQCLVTYEHAPFLWTGYLPHFAGDMLPKTIAKLKNKEPITISVSGDSISFGYQSTFSRKLPPNRPAFFTQVAEGLKTFYGAPVTLKNHAVPGWSATNGLKDLPNLLKDKPDLVFIAYGMNDIGGNNAPGYRTSVKAIIDQIHLALPDTEIILLSSSIGNSEWFNTPAERFPVYRDQLKTLTGPGCVLVDITAVWQELLRHKTYWDITGNGVNHPNDFGHSVYAEMILRLLTPMN
jgi:acyl-CoA thioesterase-1